MFSPWELCLLAFSFSRTWAIVLGVLAALLAIALLIASRTRWGENKSITTCVVLATLAHVWLLMYAYGTRVLGPGIGPGRGSQTLYVDFVSPDSDSLNPEFPFPTQDPSQLDIPTTLEAPLDSPATPNDPNTSLPSPTQTPFAPPDLLLAPSEPDPTPELDPAPEPSTTPDPSLVDTTTLDPVLESPSPTNPSTDPLVAPTDMANTLTEDHSALESNLDAPSLNPSSPPTDPTPRPPLAPSIPAPTHRPLDQKPIPDDYRNRLGNRLQLAMQYGGDTQTEAAVQDALQWLVTSQSDQGGWIASQHEAGRETRTLGEERQQAGLHADTGMTGLAILAFLGAGHTHLEGPHQQTLLRALAFLINEQMDSGDLAGRKQIGAAGGVHYSRMYCHGMATLALAEAYGMTGDARLQDPLQRAIAYTLRAQNTRTGGWRYRPGDDDPGDLSQFGWQAMSLHSYELGGHPLTPITHQRLNHFLDLVKAGPAGGLATYRPAMFSGQQGTPPMTAEALFCRHMLKQRISPEAKREAKQLLLQNLPSPEQVNLYYWYYATLALFPDQDPSWNTWNQALKQQLVSTQIHEGQRNGSWHPNCIWGGYGGRVYSTALSCLCLEVYYRYLPIVK